MKIDSNGLAKNIARRIGNYEFEVGILKDQSKAIPNRKSTAKYAGLDVSAVKKRDKRVSLAYVAGRMQKKFGWLTRPFKIKQNVDVGRVVKEIAKQVFSKNSTNNKKLENAVQAVVRNPILRGDYGKNSREAEAAKGFDKLGIDTGQFFKNIKARRL